MNPSLESAVVSAAVTSVGVLVITAAAGVALRISRSASQRLASRDGGRMSQASRLSLRRMAPAATGGRLLRSAAGLFTRAALIPTGQQPNPWRRDPGQVGRRQRRTGRPAGPGQVTDRYTKAIRQLGSDELEVRTRGIYALVRSARDTGAGHPAVPDVLAAFVRKHSREQWPVPGSGSAPAPERATRPDVQAALTVIGRWDTTDRRGRIDLTLANLTGANLISADLADAKLTGAILTGADLTGANLAGADLTSADLIRAKLTRAKLTRAKLTRADLTGAKLTRAKLTRADLTRADLTGADLTSADLTRADLTGAGLTGADLTGAQWPPGSATPAGWARHPGSGLLTRASIAVGDSGDRQDFATLSQRVSCSCMCA